MNNQKDEICSKMRGVFNGLSILHPLVPTIWNLPVSYFFRTGRSSDRAARFIRHKFQAIGQYCIDINVFGCN
jgi:hypothetical protein